MNFGKLHLNHACLQAYTTIRTDHPEFAIFLIILVILIRLSSLFFFLFNFEV